MYFLSHQPSVWSFSQSCQDFSYSVSPRRPQHWGLRTPTIPANEGPKPPKCPRTGVQLFLWQRTRADAFCVSATTKLVLCSSSAAILHSFCPHCYDTFSRSSTPATSTVIRALAPPRGRQLHFNYHTGPLERGTQPFRQPCFFIYLIGAGNVIYEKSSSASLGFFVDRYCAHVCFGRWCIVPVGWRWRWRWWCH